MKTVNMKGKPVTLKGEFPKVGRKAPDFSLVGEDLKDRTLADFKGKRKLISIVPSLDTKVCLISTKKFNEEAAKMPNTVVLVVSADLPFAQKRACEVEGIANVVPLSMMRSKKFAEDYGVLIAEGPIAGLCARAIVILDENDNVIYTELVPELSDEPNYEKALSS
jgi:thiol peroxidase